MGKVESLAFWGVFNKLSTISTW